ncbi:MFS transporter [Lyticum sinuosum]|uniref:MFS transporter n=1 Tax=Lyticum sinuosum TaxID=1332059 RepID=A0AAE4VKC0_9RICK|nr:MFS transporter [Lyticum sinuosum]MDZ5761382.1 MFS transporter [Lyticum sinuosum]
MSKNRSKEYRTSYIIWFIVSMLYGFQYLLRVFPAIAINEIKIKFGITNADFGQFAGIYYIGYSIGHIPFSILLTRYSSKNNFFIAIACILIGTLPNLTSKYWIINIIGRFIVGFGSAGILLSAMKIIRLSFNDGYEKMLGFMVTFALLLVSLFNKPAMIIIENYGFDWLILGFMIISIFMTILIFFIPGSNKIKKIFKISENEDSISPSINKKSKSEKSGVAKDVISVIFNWKIITISIIGGLMLGVLEGFADAWAMPFLKIVYNMDSNQVALGSSCIFIGLCIGFPFIGMMAEISKNKISNYILIMTCALGMLILFIMLIFKICDYSVNIFDNTVNLAHLVLFLLGILCGYQISIISEATNYVSPRLFSLSSAISNMIMMSFGSFFHISISKVISNSNDINMSNGGFTEQSLINGCMVIVICLIISITGISLLWLYDFLTRKKIKI